MAKKFKFFEKLQVSNAKSKGNFFQKSKLVSNHSELSNSARNGKKKLNIFKKLQVSNAKTKEIFFKKKSLSQMIQN